MNAPSSKLPGVPAGFARLAAAGLTLAALSVLPACGSGSADDAVFVGTWNITNGTLGANCGTLTPSESLNGATVALTTGPSGGLVADVKGCQISFDVKGNVATAKTGQTCTAMFDLAGQSLAFTLTIASATFTVTGDSGTLVQSGTATTGALPIACTYQVMADATRGAATDAGADGAP